MGGRQSLGLGKLHDGGKQVLKNGKNITLVNKILIHISIIVCLFIKQIFKTRANFKSLIGAGSHCFLTL